MACLIPDAQLSEAEKSCCRRMANRCGEMGMPSGHSCCQTTVKPQQAAMLKPAPNFGHDRVTLNFVPVAVVAVPQQVLMGRSPIRPWRHPPPDPAAPTIEILRI